MPTQKIGSAGNPPSRNHPASAAAATSGAKATSGTGKGIRMRNSGTCARYEQDQHPQRGPDPTLPWRLDGLRHADLGYCADWLRVYGSSAR